MKNKTEISTTQNNLMNVAMLTKKGFELQQAPIPQIGTDDVLIKTIGCGICESDVFKYRCAMEKGQLTEEKILGHEGSGIVEKVGENVKNFKPGDVVTSIDGLYAEYFKTNADRIVKLPEEVDPKWALGEPIACFAHAARRFGIREGDKVAIIGCGFMGLGCLQYAKLQKAGTIVAIELLNWRLETASKLSADITINLSQTDAKNKIKNLGDFDVVIEATGVQAAIDMATEMIGWHGRIILLGYHQSNNGLRTIDMAQWNFKAIDVINAHVRRETEKTAAMADAIERMRKGQLEIKSLVEYYNLQQINTAFEELVSKKEGLYKATLLMN